MAKEKIKGVPPKVQPVNTPPAHELQAGKFMKMLWLLAIVAFAAYANTINHGYAYDDYSVIKENTIVTQGIKAIPEIFSTPYRWGFFRTSNDMYRPLSLVMFAAEHQLSDGDPVLSHFVNVLLYTGCVVMLFIFLDTLFGKRKTRIAFIASLLFAVHPVHTEVVANIKSRDELLCFFFAISSLIVFIRYVADGKLQQLTVGSLLLFLSFLSKETSVFFVFLVPLIFFLYKNEHLKRAVFISLAALFAVAVFISIRYAVLHMHNAGNIADVKFIDNFLVQASTISSRVATAIYIMGMYLKILIIPYPLVSDYSFNSISYMQIDDSGVLFVLILYAFLIVLSLYRLIMYPKDIFAFGLLFYLLAIALFSNVLFFTGAAMAERFLFFPSAGFCLCIVALFEAFFRKYEYVKSKALWVLVPVLMLFRVLTISRNNDWSDNITLFSTDVKKAPANARLNYFLGNEIFRQITAGNLPFQEGFDDGIFYFHRAVGIYPGYADAYKALGKSHTIVGTYDSAEYYYKKAISLQPEDIEAWSDLDIVYFRSKNYNASIEVCKKMLIIDGAMKHKNRNIATCFRQLGQYDSARKYEALQ